MTATTKTSEQLYWPTFKLTGDDIWVSTDYETGDSVARERHVVRRGGLVTVCGASASVPEVWTPNTTKPRCPTCARDCKKDREVKPVPRKARRKKTTTTTKKSSDARVVPAKVSTKDLQGLTIMLEEIVDNAKAIGGQLQGAVIRLEINEVEIIASNAGYDEWELEFK